MLLYCSRNKHSPTTPAKLNITSYYVLLSKTVELSPLECLGSADYRASRDKQSSTRLCVITDGDGDGDGEGPPPPELALLWSEDQGQSD